MNSVVITGASSGIGREAALLFAERGWTVFAGVRRAEDGERLRDAAARSELLRPVILDVTDAAQVAAAAELVGDEVGPGGLTALVSNAGIAALGGRTSCERCPIETQQRVMDVNFFGAVRVVQALLPLLRAARGTVVFNTAMMAHTVIPFNAGYAASKCALEGWADSLRREVGPLGVRVAMLEAAYISSELETKQKATTRETDPDYPGESAIQAAMSRMGTKMAGSPTASPRRMAEAMVAAAEAERPRPRRILGAGARPIWLVGCLPDRVQDRIFGAALRRMARA